MKQKSMIAKMYKKTILPTCLIGLAVVASSCTQENEDWSDYFTNVPTNGQMSGMTGGTTATNVALENMDIAIDSTALSENESIPSSDNDYVENFDASNTIYITYSGASASYKGNVEGVKIEINGADVAVTSTAEKVNYILSGSTTDGQFKMNESDDNKKFVLTLNGVSITNNDGPAVNIQVGKRCYVVANNGTYNNFADGTSYANSNEDQKGTIFSEGELLFSGKGKIRVNGNTKAGIASDDYIMIRPNTNIYVNATAGNGIKSNDGIEVKGGVLNVEVSATAAKAISTDGYYLQSGGRVTAMTSGNGEYDSEEKDAKGAAGLKADSTITFQGGEFLAKSSGSGGKGISTDQQLVIDGGVIKVITTGKTYAYSNSIDTKAKGIKVDGSITINGGTTMVKAIGDSGSEGIESKSTMDINDGTVMVCSYDDAINTASDMTIDGGYVYAQAIGNDGLDSNGNLYIKGGLVYAIGTSSPEVAIDANTEGGKKLYVTGGTIIAIGGLESGSSLTQSCYSASSWTANTWYALKYGDKTFAFKTPSGGGSGLVVSASSTPSLNSGVSINGGTEIFSETGYMDATISGGNEVSLSNYTGGSQGGMGGGRPGWGW